MSDVRLIDANDLKRDFAELCATECAICSFYISSASVADCHCGLIDRAPTIAKCGRTSDGFPFMDLRPKPTGEWIEITNGRGGHECNLCGEYASNYQSGCEYLSAFCPNCGAEMKVVEEAEEE